MSTNNAATMPPAVDAAFKRDPQESKLCMAIAKIRMSGYGLLARSVVVDDSERGGSVIRCGDVVGPGALTEAWLSELSRPGGARITFEFDSARTATFDRCRVSLVQHMCDTVGMRVCARVVINSDTPVAAAVAGAARCEDDNGI